MKVKSQLHQARYLKFIESRKGRTLEGPKERHHIIPTSCGGTNDPSNLIDLTLREHYIAHWMLASAYESEPLRRAFFMMSNRLGRKASKAYQEYRLEVVERLRESMKDKMSTEEARAENGKVFKGLWDNNEEFVVKHKERSSKMMKANNANPEFQKLRLEKLEAVYKSSEFSNASKVANWNRYKDKWFKAQSFYQQWVEAGKPVKPMDFCRAFGGKAKDWNYWQSFHKRFVEQGWIPCEDPTWLEWSRSS